MRFWVDKVPISPEESRSHGDEEHPNTLTNARDVGRAPTTPEQRSGGSAHKRFRIETVAEEVLILVEERVTARMMVIRGDTSPRAKILVTVGNTFPRMIAHHYRDCRINPESHRKIKSLKVARCTPWNR